MTLRAPGPILVLVTTTHTTFCSNFTCTVDLTVDLGAETVTAHVPSNGLRGSKHVPAHEATADAFDDDGLIVWDCPVCEYADSLDLTEVLV